MHYSVRIEPRLFHFKQRAHTSRGSYTVRPSWFIHLSSDADDYTGIGECAPLPDLSCDAHPAEGYEPVLRRFCTRFEQEGVIPFDEMGDFPSMLFGLESAVQNYRLKSFRLFDTPFSRGEEGITINGLIWMGRFDEMMERIKEKIEKGFTCIKIKIGSIDFQDEITLLRYIRTHFSVQTMEIRLDANGAFSGHNVLSRLEQLAPFGIHSIEQPVRAGQWDLMADVCYQSPIPIALDEELIGITTAVEKERLLNQIQPQYIILKPSLHGGMYGTKQWIDLARARNIGFWFTSALESNIGLNAIAQWSALCNQEERPLLPQGLGTGQLFTDNIPFPLQIKKDKLWFTD